MHKLDWRDLQYVLAVAQTGSLTAAAKTLDVNHSTVLRRINSFERMHAVRLFDRKRTGYSLTVEGRQILDGARSVAGAVDQLEQKIATRGKRLSGKIRLTTTDSFLFSLVGPHLAHFQREFPDVIINVSVTNQTLNLTRRDADVAIRPGVVDPDPLAGEKISDINCAVYAAPEYWRDNQNRALDDQPWLGFSDVLVNSSPGRWMKANIPSDRVVFSANSFLALRQAAELGGGVAILPCFLGDATPKLMRAGGVLEPCRSGLWILTHKDLIHAPRIRAFTDFMKKALATETARLMGTI